MMGHVNQWAQPMQNQQQQQTLAPQQVVGSGPREMSSMNNSNGYQSGHSPPKCIRQGCAHPAIVNSEWADEYCSRECVVSHCRDVFTSWVASNQNAAEKEDIVK